MRPLFDRVLVRRAKVVGETEGGLVIPDAAKILPSAGEVVSAGPDCKCLGNGDKIFFSQYAGTEIEVEGEKLIILREEDVLCVDR